MAKRFTKPTIKWNEFSKLVPAEQMPKFMAFKSKADVYLRRVIANPPEPPPIPWEKYMKSVPVPGLVAKMKSAYETFKVPYPTDTMTAKVDEQWSALQKEVETFCVQQQQVIDSAIEELDRIKALPKFEDMTMETLYDMYPKDALDPVNRPTFWPHTPDEQLGYVPPETKSSTK